MAVGLKKKFQSRSNSTVGLLSAIAILALALPSLSGVIHFTSASDFAFLAMRFTSAWGFALVGIALGFLSLRQRLAARVMAGFAGLFSLTVLFQDTAFAPLIRHLFKSEELLQDPAMRTPMMGALALLALSVSVALASARRRNIHAEIVTALLSCFAGSAGTMTLLATTLGIGQNFDQMSSGHMSLASAIGFSIAGVTLYLRALSRIRSSSDTAFHALPLIAVALLSSSVMLLWQYSLHRENSNFREHITSVAAKANDQFRVKVEQVSNSLSRFAARIELLGVSNEAFLELDSQNHLDQMPILKRLGIADKQSLITWSFPKSLRHQLVNYDKKLDPKREAASEDIREAAFRDTRTTHKPSVSKTLPLRTGQMGNIVPVALYQNGKFVGSVFGVIESDQLFKDWFDKSNFRYNIVDSGVTVFNQEATSIPLEEFTENFHVRWGNAEWQVTITPTEAYRRHQVSSKSWLIVLVGEFFSLVFGLLLHILFRAQKREAQFSEMEAATLARTNLALEAAQIGAWNLELNSKINGSDFWRSRDFDQIFGQVEAGRDWQRREFFHRIVPEDRAQFFSQWRSVLISKDPLPIDLRIRRIDSQAVSWIRLVAQTQRDAQGTPVRIFGIVRDITADRKQQSERELDLEWKKSILDSAGYSIISTDAHGVIQTFNSAAENLLGYRAVDMIGKATPALFRDADEIRTRAEMGGKPVGNSDRLSFDHLIDSLRSTKAAENHESIYISKSGKRIPVNLSVTPLSNSKGEVLGFLGIAIDLTQKKKAEEDLRLTYDRLQRLISASGLGIWERDVVTKKISFMDDQCKLVFGFLPDEYPSYEEITALIDPEDLNKLNEKVREHIAMFTPRFEVLFRVRGRFGAEVPRWIKCVGRVTSKDGRLDQVIATMGDVTNETNLRTALEEALVTSQAATKAKSAFLASMSHEIRTPLNGIIGMTELLMDTPLQPEQTVYTKVLQRSGAALLALINDILDFSKLEAEKMELEHTEINLATIVESQIDILAIKAREKKIALTSFISPELTGSHLGDGGRLGQVLLNLLSNAIKFTELGGVDVRVIELSNRDLKTGHRLVRFEVQDSGSGISKEGIAKLFSPFTQADSSIGRKFGGTGLGLSICKKLVEGMNGAIGVSTLEGQGSIFWFETPLESVATTLSSFDQYQATFNGVRTLLLEDGEARQNTLKSYFSAFAMRTQKVTSVPDALAAMKFANDADDANDANDPFKLVIISSSLAGESSMQVYKALHAAGGNDMTRVVCVSEFAGKADDEIIAANLRTLILREPMKQSELFDAMKQVIEQKITVQSIHSKAAKPKKAFELDASKFNILVAEDNAVNQLLIRRTLLSMGFSPHIVSNGREAIEALGASPFDLVLMDCQMPEVDGFEATRLIRASTNLSIKNVRVVALTANAMAGDSQLCFDAGMDDYLTKPMNREKLQEALVKWLTPLAA